MVRVGGHRYCVQTNIALTNELDISTDDLNTSQFTNYGRWLLMEQCNHHHEGIARNSEMGLSATLRDFTANSYQCGSYFFKNLFCNKNIKILVQRDQSEIIHSSILEFEISLDLKICIMF